MKALIKHHDWSSDAPLVNVSDDTHSICVSSAKKDFDEQANWLTWPPKLKAYKLINVIFYK